MGRDQLRSSRNILQRFTNVFGLVFSIQLLITLHRVEGNLLAGSWAYDAGSSSRFEGHTGLTTDGDNSTCLITKVYSNPWLRVEIGNKDGSTHGKLFVVNAVHIVKCQGQKCEDNSPDIYVSTSTDVTKLTDTEKCGSYDSRVSSRVTCSSALIGSNVFLRVTENSRLGVCDVIANGYPYQATDCTNSHYGPACGIPCNCQSQCHSVTGVCTGSCDAGWTKDSKGICSIQACTNDRYGPGCNTPCNCKSQCDSSSGVCSVSCDAGKMKDNAGVCSVTCNNNHYGEDCREPCNCQSQCDPVSGSCSGSCVAGKMKDNAGVCSVTCNNNHYGEDCRKPCNCQSQCDPVSGSCSRSCVAGKMKDNAEVCSVTCNNGGYGVDCNTPCHCTPQCGHESGLCVSSCDSGWLKGANGACNIKNCTNGNYGRDCTSRCHCSSQCHVMSGVCSDACVAGRMKDGVGVCTVKCTGGLYGVDCKSLCHCKSQCNVVNGTCADQCDAEWKKDQYNVCSIAIMPLLEVAQTSNTMTFKWNTTASVSEYLVQYREKDTDEWQNMTSTNSDDDLIIANLTHNTEYEVRVVSHTRPDHWIGSFKTACKRPLPPKITMLDSSIEGNLAQVSFKLGATDPQCDNIKMIKVNYSDGNDWKIKEFPNPSSQQLQKMMVSGLKPGITYQIVVIVINNEDMETQSESSSMKTKTKPVDSIANEQMEEQTLIIIIVVVAVLAALIIILFLVFIWYRLRKKKQAVVLLEKKEKRISRAYEMDAVVMDGPYNDNDSAYMVSIADEVPVVNAQAPVAVVAPHIEEAHDNNAANNVEEVKPEMAVVDEENVLPTEPIYGNINDSNISHMLKVTELAAYIEAEEKLEEPFKEEFKQIPSGVMAVCDVGQRPENRPKNRFTNIWPYDHRRVVLSQIGDNVNTDYINACYVDGYKKSNTYIASQAPKKITINDMWRMIWEINCKRIVMVTRAMEGGKVKCEDYWPEHGPDTYGDITVQPVNTKEFADYTIRIFNVSKSGETHNIIHFCFTSWPDHNVPSSTSPLLTFHRKIRSYDASHDGIMLIHCSAGVGRTGAFIALDYLLEQGAKEGQVDVYSCVQLMRTQRVNMIQTVAQYKFVYTCLRDAFMSGETCCSSNDFRDYYSRLLLTEEGSGKSKMEAQFEALQCLIPKLSSFDFSSAMDQENSEKNRSQDILPDNFNRPFLITHVSGRNNYINAVFANSFQKKNGFIVTQMPLTETVIDFWRMIYDHNVRTIVMLNSLGEDDKDNGRYWPNDRQTRTYVPFKITVGKTEHPLEDIAVRTIKLMNSQKANDETRAIKQFQLTSWSDTSDIPQDKVSVQLLTEQVEAWHSVTSGPIVIHDLFGASKCGVFCVVSSARERIRVDQEVDIFMTARQVCQARPQLMDKLEQYTFCHEIIGSYLSQFDVYENFQPMTKL